MIYSVPRGRGGSYEYYFCVGKNRKECAEPYLSVDSVEQAVSRYYSRTKFDPEFVRALRSSMLDTMKLDQTATLTLRRQLST